MKAYYIKKISHEELTKAYNLRKFAEYAPIMTTRILDDSKIKADSFAEAEQMGAPLIYAMGTNLNAATVRFIDCMQKLEDKYKSSKNDKIVDLELCKTKTEIWGELKFLSEAESN